MGTITCENLLAPNALENAGVSMRKQGYITNIANLVLKNELSKQMLMDMPQGEAINKLTALPGIGVWTAQMLMLFTLGDKDILSYGDFGIRNGIKILYGISEIEKQDFGIIAKRLSPYGSIASFYFWHISAYGLPS